VVPALRDLDQEVVYAGEELGNAACHGANSVREGLARDPRYEYRIAGIKVVLLVACGEWLYRHRIQETDCTGVGYRTDYGIESLKPGMR